MALSDPILLLADIGGTHARFVLWRGGAFLNEPAQWKAVDHPDLPSAMDAYLRNTGDGVRVDGVSVCGAGPVLNGHIELTNSPWAVDAAEIAAVTGVRDPVIVNDFTAMAMGVRHVGAEHHRRLGGGTALEGAAIGVMGPGTGLGVSGLVPDGHGQYWPLAGEGGHVDLAPGTAREMAVLVQMMTEDSHVSAEDVCSGPGLQKLYRSLCAVDGATADDRLDAAAISERAQTASDPYAVEAVGLFIDWLGAVSGNLALTLGALGGVYLTGGILPRWGAMFDAARYRARFEAKGRFRPYMERIPTIMVTGGRPPLHGLVELWKQIHDI